MNLLITGITGNFGYAVYRQLAGRGDLRLFAGARNPERVNFLLDDPEIESRRFDFNEPETFGSVLRDIDTVILLRPSALTEVRRYVPPFVEACREGGVEHIVFLSIQGVENNRRLPHYKIERYIEQSGIPYTFLRPGFFMENLITTHRDEIRYRSKLIVPAGEGRTNFIAVGDVAAAAAACVGKPEHYRRAYELTGPEAYDYYQVAEILSQELGRPVRYENPSRWEFFRYRRSLGDPIPFVIVMILLYRRVKKGGAEARNENLQRVFEVEPQLLRNFIREKLDYLRE